MPPRRGMRTSSRADVDAVAAAAPAPPRRPPPPPPPRCPACRSSRVRMPERTSVSSSAIRTRITPAVARRAGWRGAGSRRRARVSQVEGAADLLQPPPHAREALARPRRGPRPRRRRARRARPRRRATRIEIQRLAAAACLTELVTISWQQRSRACARSGSAQDEARRVHVDERPRDRGGQRAPAPGPRSTPRSRASGVHHRLDVVEERGASARAPSPAAREHRVLLGQRLQVEAERGQVMAHGVVQLARDAQPLVEAGALAPAARAWRPARRWSGQLRARPHLARQQLE